MSDWGQQLWDAQQAKLAGKPDAVQRKAATQAKNKKATEKAAADDAKKGSSLTSAMKKRKDDA